MDAIVDLRRVRLFKNGTSQALRIPRDLELPGSEAMIHKEGDRLIVEPVPKVSLLALLASWEPIEEKLPEFEDRLPEPVSL